MPESHPVLAEAIRELKDVVNQLRDDLVRKDVYVAERDADRAEVQTLRRVVEKLEATLTWLSRALVTSLLLPLISTVIVVYVIQQGAK